LKNEWLLKSYPKEGFFVNLNLNKLNIPYHIASKIFWSRDLRNQEDIQKFLNINENKIYSKFNHMNLAIERINKALENNEKIGVFGDFDVDGLSGTAIIIRLIENFSGKIYPLIPKREQDGHGLTAKFIDAYKDIGVKLIITVDTGSTSLEEIEYANLLGIDTIITDHHLNDGKQPNAYAIINPHGSSNEKIQNDYSGSGVAYKLAEEFYKYQNIEIPDYFTSLAALGTISDQVSLKSENRRIVSEGLKALGKTNLPGLRELFIVSRQNNNSVKINTEFISYYVAPRLNAPGRLGDSEPSLQLLVTNDETEAKLLANRIDFQNEERKNYSAQAWDLALPIIEKQKNDLILAVDLSDFPLGILGPIAGKICEFTSKPAIVYKIDSDFIKASCRSNENYDLFTGLSLFSKIFERFGGHKRAAGFTIKKHLFDDFISKLKNNAFLSKLSSHENKKIEIDAQIDIEDLTPSLWKFTDLLEPFGVDNNEPVFLIKNLLPNEIIKVGKKKNHIKINFYRSGKKIEAIGFNLAEKISKIEQVDIVFTLKTNIWREKVNYQLNLIDIEKSE
tara:strand:+ start:4715 stop:6403 length:1689 start_codon:yes stop_codon:yes gene_type:complete